MIGIQTFYPRTVATWRSWLEKNHSRKDAVRLLKYKKHTGKPSITHQESMDEAICFGWIDTTVKRIDEETYVRNFVRRKKTAGWSKNTLKYAKRLIKEGRMAPAGLKAYKLGLKKPVIGHDIPDNPDSPPELVKALNTSKRAMDFFSNLAPSYKRQSLRWLMSAKLPATKKKRISVIVERCKERKKF